MYNEALRCKTNLCEEVTGRRISFVIRNIFPTIQERCPKTQWVTLGANESPFP